MSVDLGTPVLEVAIALSFVFFLLSLIVSAGTEAAAWVSKRRSKDLVKGIEGLLGDSTVATGVIAHPLVQTDVTTPPDENAPSYVSSRNFALALIDTVRQGGEAAVEIGQEAGDAYEALKKAIQDLPESSPLRVQLGALLSDAEADVTAFRKSVEGWFDDAMDRVSGWYKRWSQTITICIAIVVTIGLNASTVRIAERLADDPALRAAVVTKAEAASESGSATEGAEEGLTPAEAGEKVEDAYAQLDGLELPLLWSGENVPWASPSAAVLTIVGWLLTIAAISLGAPFWFDSLGKLARLRTSGKRPEDKDPKT